MTGHLRNMSGGDLSAENAPGSPAATGDRLAHGGGRHMKAWPYTTSPSVTSRRIVSYTTSVSVTLRRSVLPLTTLTLSVSNFQVTLISLTAVQVMRTALVILLTGIPVKV